MKHENYYEIEAENHFDMGLKVGQLFKDMIVADLDAKKSKDEHFEWKTDFGMKFFEVTKEHFPEYINEITGMSEGAGIDFKHLWMLILEDRLDKEKIEGCTTMVTNGGLTVLHNEDWTPESYDKIVLIKKKINGLTTLELRHTYGIGGDSVGMNSNGYVFSVNTLIHRHNDIGVPRNIIGRFLADTKDPMADLEKLKIFKRSNGYNHNIVSLEGKILNIEMTENDIVAKEYKSPYVHTNNFLGILETDENTTNRTSTFQRYFCAMNHLKENMTIEELKDLSNLREHGTEVSIFSERTIGKMIIDLRVKKAHVWLKRENEKGFIEYDLDFLK